MGYGIGIGIGLAGYVLRVIFVESWRFWKRDKFWNVEIGKCGNFRFGKGWVGYWDWDWVYEIEWGIAWEVEKGLGIWILDFGIGF